MVLSSNNTTKWHIQELSVDILMKQTIAAAKWKSYFRAWELGETTDLGSDAEFMVFVRYRATEDYVKQFLFCRPCAKHTIGKEIFKKVKSFI